jgi:hypothetical protein
MSRVGLSSRIGLRLGVLVAGLTVVTFGPQRVAAAPSKCPRGVASEGCPVPTRDLSHYLNIVGPGVGPALAYVLGDTFRLKAGARRNELVGYDSHGACDSLLRSPNGRYVLYGVSRNGWPALELLDVVTGARSLFRARACYPAWGDDGQIAYLRYTKFSSATGDYSGRGHVVVQHGLTGASSIWTRVGAWATPIWAGADLLIGSDAGSVTPGPLKILYGPGKSRNVDDQSSSKRAPFSTVVALNPQGTEALLDTERLGPDGGAGGAEDSAILIRISDGEVLSTTILNSNDSTGNSDLTALAPGGSWIGNQIITTDGVFWGGTSHPPATLITLTVTDNHVRVRSVRQLIQYGRLPLAEDLDQVTQASFLNGDRQHVAVWFKAIGQILYLACNTATERCTTSPNYAATPTPTATFVTSASRP